MSKSFWVPLLGNIAFLLAFVVVYEAGFLIFRSKLMRQVANGLFGTAISIAIMSLPFQLYPGVLLDLRTILISVMAVAMGVIPAGITAAAASLYWLAFGGESALAGVAVVISAAAIGLAWRRWVFQKNDKWRWQWLNFYTLGIAVHLAALACVVIFPSFENKSDILQIAWPVLIGFPITMSFAGVHMLQQNRRWEYKKWVNESEEKYRRIMENISDIVWTADMNLNITYVSPSIALLFGEAAGERAKLPIEKRFPPSSIKKMRELLQEELKKEEDPQSNKDRSVVAELEYYRKDGNIGWYTTHVKLVRDNEGRVNGFQGTSRDITKEKEVEAAFMESERSKSVLLSHIPGMAYRCAYDKEWTMSFVSAGCYELTGHEPEALLGNRKLSFNDLISEEHREKLWNEWSRAVTEKLNFRQEYEIITASGEKKWVIEKGQPVYDSQGNVEALEGIIIDITESKKSIEHINYINVHDLMTGVYNRRKYELEKERIESEGRFPVSVIIADINGIRTINEKFGEAEGDRFIIKTAKILQSCFGECDFIARTGGDEFSIILPGADSHEAGTMLKEVKEAFERYNQSLTDTTWAINLSVGFGTKDEKGSSLEEAEKRAEEFMLKRKLFERESYHSSILSTFMATMLVRSQETEEHEKRIAHMCIEIGRKLGLPQHSLDELQLFSMLHDIGKIGIDDRILNKPGKLSEAEMAAMKTHSEIGNRIVGSVSELESVAEYILTHHERWDGEGYPLGKRGEEIPLLSRILAVADAYDAMTQNRVYRKAISREAAIKEIEKNSGTQFDPEIVWAFFEIMRENEADFCPVS
ncbi:MAG: PAS domain S-box protein [Clostridia bacterium]|nr:PAS domain S-box protein [Clostridia bacterium]